MNALYVTGLMDLGRWGRSLGYGHAVVITAPMHAEIVRVAVSDELAYWTVLAGPTLTVVGDVDDHLRHLRFGRSCEESTTKTYAGHLKRLHIWSEERGLTWNDAALRMASYVMHLRTTPRSSTGRGHGQLPEEATLAPALAAIHGFYLHLADLGRLQPEAFSALFTTVPAETGRGTVAVRPRIRVDSRPSPLRPLWERPKNCRRRWALKDPTEGRYGRRPAGRAAVARCRRTDQWRHDLILLSARTARAGGFSGWPPARGARSGGRTIPSRAYACAAGTWDTSTPTVCAGHACTLSGSMPTPRGSPIRKAPALAAAS